jgi:class 3 adenylate cyclase
MASPVTRHLTILLTDIKGFTDKTSSKSRADIQRLLDDHREVVLPVLQGRGGKLVKTIGDAFLMVFESPTDAVLAGLAAQEALAKRNDGLPEAERIEIRIAINSGEVNLVEGDVFGEPVNITARIEGVAEAGEVYFTEAVYLSMNKAEVPSSEVGLLQLKGIPEKVRVYKVRRETPLGVGQVPPKVAPVKAAGFAPGEKARFVPAAGAAPAALPGASDRAALKLRARAIVVDFFVVTLLSGSLAAIAEDILPGQVGGAPSVSVKAHPAGVTIREKGVSIRLDEQGIAEGADEERSPRRGRRVSATSVTWVLFGWLCLWRFGGVTPGKRLLGLRVVAEDGGPVDGQRALLRAAVSLVSWYSLGLGYLWAFKDPQGRTWHDLIAGTRVIRATSP